MEPVTEKQAKHLILNGRAPAGMRVEGKLDLSGQPVAVLPPGLEVHSLNLANCTALRELPPGLKVRSLDASGCTSLARLPAGLSCYKLIMRRTAVTRLPDDLDVKYRLDLEDCDRLESLPAGLTVGSLILRNCTALSALPEGLSVYFLDISGCARLSEWPRSAWIRYGHLVARHCANLTALPGWLTQLAQLDLRGCIAITSLPEGLRVSGWIDLADTQVAELPAGLKGVQLRWRGVAVDERIVFRPETITAQEVLGETNVELRRVKMERLGYETFVAAVKAQVLHRDDDRGGERQLLRVPLPDDEPLVCISVRCPSTARRYIIRVPPQTRTCHQAAAWIAGFDNPDDYRPRLET